MRWCLAGPLPMVKSTILSIPTCSTFSILFVRTCFLSFRQKLLGVLLLSLEYLDRWKRVPLSRTRTSFCVSPSIPPLLCSFRRYT